MAVLLCCYAASHFSALVTGNEVSRSTSQTQKRSTPTSKEPAHELCQLGVARWQTPTLAHEMAKRGFLIELPLLGLLLRFMSLHDTGKSLWDILVVFELSQSRSDMHRLQYTSEAHTMAVVECAPTSTVRAGGPSMLESNTRGSASVDCDSKVVLADDVRVLVFIVHSTCRWRDEV